MQDSPYSFLNIGGEMGERMRQLDWASTPVGDPSTWPAALRVTVSTLLRSKFPMFLLWGEDYTQFYNDAYRPSFGTEGKHPTALGQRGEDCWVEAWSILRPLLDEVRIGGEAIWKEDQYVPIYRNGKLETTYWTFSYSPVINDDGNIGGVLSTCFETTEKVLGIVRLNESSDQLRFAIEATDLGTWDLNPSTGRFSANARLKSWFGLKPEEEIPLDFAVSAIAEQDRQRVADAISRAMEYGSGGKYEEIYTIINKETRHATIVLAKGRAWFNEENKAYRFNGTLQDITVSRVAAKAQQEIEARFRNVSNTSPTGLWLSDTEGYLTYLNKTLVDWTGIPYEQLLGGGWLKAIVEEDQEHAAAAFSGAIQVKGHYETEFRIKRFDGAIVWCKAAGDPFYDENGSYVGYAGFCMNIQDQKDLQEKIDSSRRQVLKSFEEAPVAIATIDRYKHTFTMANRFYCELVGRKYEDIINKPLLEALPEIAGQGFDKLLDGVLDTGIPYSSKEVPVDIVRNNELQKIYVDLVYQPQYGADETISGILVVATDVTQQVESRTIIQQNEAKFRSLIEEAPVATCLFVGREMVVELANDVMLSYWGKNADVLGLPLQKAVPELIGQPFLSILDDIYSSGIAYSERSAEAQLNRNGKLETFYFDYTYKPLKNIHGQVYAIMDMAVDVTEQVIARRKLEESERFSRYIFHNSPVAKLVYVGADMILAEANEAMLDIFGRDTSILGQPIMQTIPELQQTDLMGKYVKVLTTGEPHYEYGQKILLIKKGEPYWGYYDYIYKPLYDVESSIYGVVCTAIDVTKEVMIREEIIAAEQSLRNAIELAELATWNVDLVNRKIEYSERLQEWLGVAGAQLQIDASPRIHPHDQQRIANAMKEALQPGNGYFNEKYTVVNIVTGQLRVIHSNGVAKFDENGIAVSMSGTARDITLQQQLETTLKEQVQQRTEELAAINEELAASNEELTRSNEELSQYAYVASHDLQEPLRKIRIFSDMVQEQPELSARSKLYIDKVSSASERLMQLIKDLLDFSRLNSSNQAKTTVDLNVTLSNVLEDFELLISEKHATVSVTVLPTVYALGLQMNQLLYNLISNALKFTNAATAPHIQITSAEVPQAELKQYLKRPGQKKYYKISIRDNGIGFSEDYKEQIFDVFKRLHLQEDYKGSGIGLSLCRRIVTNHGGAIMCSSKVGEGSTFDIILPEY